MKMSKKQGQTLRILGTDLDFKQIFSEFFSGALKKTRSTCGLKRLLVCKLKARAGTDLDFKQIFF